MNKKGEVLGLSTLYYEPGGVGENLNFAISAKHLRDLYSKASSQPKPWTALPKGRGPEPGFRGGSDPVQTLEAWKTFNRGMSQWKNRVEETQKRLEAIPKADPRNPMHNMTVRNKKFQASMKSMGAAYCDFATKIKNIDVKKIDQELLGFIFRQAMVLERIGKSYNDLASSIALNNENAAEYAKAKAEAYKEILDGIDMEYEIPHTRPGSNLRQGVPHGGADRGRRQGNFGGGPSTGQEARGGRVSRFGLPHLDERRWRARTRCQVRRRNRRCPEGETEEKERWQRA